MKGIVTQSFVNIILWNWSLLKKTLVGLHSLNGEKPQDIHSRESTGYAGLLKANIFIFVLDFGHHFSMAATDNKLNVQRINHTSLSSNTMVTKSQQHFTGRSPAAQNYWTQRKPVYFFSTVLKRSVLKRLFSFVFNLLFPVWVWMKMHVWLLDTSLSSNTMVTKSQQHFTGRSPAAQNYWTQREPVYFFSTVSKRSVLKRLFSFVFNLLFPVWVWMKMHVWFYFDRCTS